jgi:hypothetical protein
MKVTDIRRKLAATLMAGAMLAPSAAAAADLNVNLVRNPGFENLDATDSHILDWTDGSGLGYTYAFSQNYDNGGPLAGGGNVYFTSNAGDYRTAGIVSQSIDISAGASGALIASGNAAFSLSGFFSTYLGNNDFGFLQVDFRNASNATLGSRVIGPNANLQNWTRIASGGAIPVGTQTAFLSVYGDGTNGGPDGYIDNVDFQVTDEVILPTLDLRVDRDDGSLILSNRTGSPVNISGYQLTSAFGGLAPANWVSITDNYDANNGGAVDGTNNWTRLTQAAAHGDLSEADLASGNGGALGHTQSINLGNAGAWIRNPNEDLVFQYISSGTVVTGLVTFEDAAPFGAGDFNTDGLINAADWAILRTNQHADLSGDSLAEAYRRGDLTGDRKNNHADFAAFKAIFETANGAAAFQALFAPVPEPSTIVLLLSCGVFALPSRRRAS